MGLHSYECNPIIDIYGDDSGMLQRAKLHSHEYNLIIDNRTDHNF